MYIVCIEYGIVCKPHYLIDVTLYAIVSSCLYKSEILWIFYDWLSIVNIWFSYVENFLIMYLESIFTTNYLCLEKSGFCGFSGFDRIKS